MQYVACALYERAQLGAVTAQYTAVCDIQVWHIAAAAV
jgi:hypothetical protein